MTLGRWSKESRLGPDKPTTIIRLDTIARKPGAPGDLVAERIEPAEFAPTGDSRLQWRRAASWHRVGADSVEIFAWSTTTESEGFYGRWKNGSLQGVVRRTSDAIPVDPLTRQILWDVWPWATASLVRVACPSQAPRHYVFFGMDREKLPNATSFFDTKAFEGAQVTYSWRQLEHQKDNYDFSLIREDLALLSKHNKKLWIQIQDVSFNEKYIHVPKYLLNEPEFHGGIARQYNYANNAGEGWVARRWDPAVQARLHKLFDELGREFDGRITGVNLDETSIEFGKDNTLEPQGFTFTGYVDAVITNMRALKRAFPKSIVIQYANFMPGEWRPTDNHGYLDSVYVAARKMGVGVGGPDVLPTRPGQLGSSYPLIHDAAAAVPVGIAVQDGNLAEVNAKTGKRVTAIELLDFASSYLGADFIFWGIQEPYFSEDVVPTIAKSGSD